MNHLNKPSLRSSRDFFLTRRERDRVPLVQLRFVQKPSQFDSNLLVRLMSTNQIRDFSTSLGLVFSQIVSLNSPLNEPKLIFHSHKEINFISLWLKSDKTRSSMLNEPKARNLGVSRTVLLRVR